MQFRDVSTLRRSVLCLGVLAIVAVPGLADTSYTGSETFKVGQEGRILLIPVRVEDRTWMFGLDTGAAMTVFDTSLRSHLGEPQDEITLKTSSGFGRARRFGCPEAYVGQWSLQELGSVACLDLEGIRRASGESIYGILGIDFLQNFAVEIDFDAGRVKFFASPPDAWKSASESISLIRGPGRIFYVDAQLPGRRELFSLDTGSNNSTLRTEVFDRLSDRGEIAGGGCYQGVTVAGGVQGESGYLSRLEMGCFSNEGIRVDRDKLSALGLRLLSRYKLRIDFPGKRLYVEPGKHYRDPEPIATSGLSIVQVDGKKVVVGVVPGGPAAAENIQPGDVITHVQGLSVSSIDLFSLGRILTSTPGARVSLRFQRGDAEQECRLILHSRLQPPAADGTTFLQQPAPRK